MKIGLDISKSINTKLKKKKYSLHKGTTIQLSIMSTPAVILFLALSYLPMFGLIVAFKDYRVADGFLGSKWIGLKNFEFLFTSTDAWRITRNTLGYNLTFIIVGLLINVSFALMLNEITRRTPVKIFQTAMFFPHFVSWVVAGYMLYAFISIDKGILNMTLQSLNLDIVEWYARPGLWPFIFVFAAIWKHTGYGAIMYYAALMGIDSSYYEAAEIDGATRLQRVWHISLPMLTPVIIILTILGIGNIFHSDYGMFFNLPREIGMLFETTEVIDTYVLRMFRFTSIMGIGMATAAGFYQSVVGFALVLLSNLAVKKYNKDYSLF